jgi:hypothetical protein
MDREGIFFHDFPGLINAGNIGDEQTAYSRDLRAGTDELRLLIAIIQKISMLSHQRVDYFERFDILARNDNHNLTSSPYSLPDLAGINFAGTHRERPVAKAV